MSTETTKMKKKAPLPLNANDVVEFPFNGQTVRATVKNATKTTANVILENGETRAITLDDTVVRVEAAPASKKFHELLCPNGPNGKGAKPQEAKPQTPASPVVLMLDPKSVEVSPWQPRTLMDEAEMIELVEDVKARGVLQPVAVRTVNDRYQLIFGHRRREAALRADKSLPCLVQEMDDQEAAEQALIENLVRSDLNPIDAARGYERLAIEFKMTQEQIAAKTKRSQPVIANALRLLQLPQEVQTAIAEKVLTGSHGETLLLLENQEDRAAFARRAVENEWSVKSLREEIKTFIDAHKPPELFAEKSTAGSTAPIAPAPANTANSIDSDKRLVLAVLTTEGQLWGAIVNAAGINRYRCEMAMRELVDEGKAKIEGERWFKIPDASQVGDYDTPTPQEKALEKKDDVAAPSNESTGASALPVAPERPQSQSEATGQSVAPIAQDEAAKAPKTEAPTSAPVKTAVEKAKENAAAPAPSSSPAADAKADAGKQWIQVDKVRLLKLQDAGLTIEAILEAAEKLVEIGESKGLDVDDMLTSIEAYFNGDEEAASEEETTEVTDEEPTTQSEETE